MNATYQQENELHDNMLVQMSMDAIRDRLKETREDGKHGWFSELCSVNDLQNTAVYETGENHFLDAAIYNLMCYMKTEHINED